ncbi:M23 family metallopeptidase [Alkalihalobacillus sp. R86527]|uniref:M23 family metallopeptidase n=1 Tax=Alkalihalobacillus sp. R86527 TaxID=3093863 RepID=UPI00367363DB
MRKYSFLILILFFLLPATVSATEQNEDELRKARMMLFNKMETITQLPWYVYAGIDQYERSIRRSRNDIPREPGAIAINISPEKWAGGTNPNKEDTSPESISFFGGIALDGNEDGKASRTDDEDLLFTIGSFLQKYGTNMEDIRIGLWDYYQRDQAVRTITSNCLVYKTFNTLKLEKHAFPVPLTANYSYRNTWGDRRGWGGLRIHEGTDIFASYGVPVKATSYGTVETKGWNRYGGWRIGIRDINGNYHYYAHLNGFEKGIDKGSIVQPEQVIGYVGSSGYGPKGTAGKFPPHLHYGIYKDNGKTEWSYDPYPSLRLWERQERINKKKN